MRLLPLLIAFFTPYYFFAQDTLPQPTESDYYRILKVPIPEGVVLEVGGLCALNDGSVAASTRRGDVWVVENPASMRPNYRRFAAGLHEVLGLAEKDGKLYCA
ncbi:MAG: auracyanin family protein, partial [Saprospiraceae bacterium]|nr:auracyanin family protein [Saprospiraceae bacterium]